MKKTMFMLAAAFLASQGLHAQVLEKSTTMDNWYIGIGGGGDTKTIHNPYPAKHINSHAMLRVGRNLTPVAGWQVEGTAFFGDKLFGHSHTVVKATNLDLLGTINFSNWFGGYIGIPRAVEIVGLGGLGWNRHFGESKTNYINTIENDLIAKVGVEIDFNLGLDRAWQFFIQPAINYDLDHWSRAHFNLNYSALQLSCGFNYKFKNSNGTHNFKFARMRDQAEIDALNVRINELRAESQGKDQTIADKTDEIESLKQQVAALKKQEPVVREVVKQVTTTTNAVLQPTVIFQQGSSTIDAAQYASIAMVARYMRNHPNAKILIKGYASPEGSAEINKRISVARAQAVKDALVQRYAIAASRLSVKGMGATDELFDEVDFNRVATFTDTTK